MIVATKSDQNSSARKKRQLAGEQARFQPFIIMGFQSFKNSRCQSSDGHYNSQLTCGNLVNRFFVVFPCLMCLQKSLCSREKYRDKRNNSLDDKLLFDINR